MSSREALLSYAEDVANEYQAAGYSLTLRQLYYQLVARGFIENSDRSYKRLGAALSHARLQGWFDPGLLVDRGREAGESKHHECKLNVDEGLVEARDWIRSVPHWAIRADRWYGQPVYVSVWCEKDALSGVFEPPCKDLGVGLFACKGYPSHSALWSWLQGLSSAYEISRGDYHESGLSCESPSPIEEAVVLYFGDHDPDGWQIPRSALDVMRQFASIHGLSVPDIRFVRVALNMDQIQQHNPPPFPAKVSSSRYEGYLAEHGTDDAWELDALDVKTLDALVRTFVSRYWSEDDRLRWRRLVASARAELREAMVEGNWLRDTLSE